MNIPLVDSSNDNVFFEAYLIFLGILLSKVFSEAFTDLATLSNKYKIFKLHMYDSAKDFQFKYKQKKRFYLKRFIFVYINLLLMFGYQTIFAIWIASIFDAIFQGIFETLKENRVYFFVVVGSVNFLVIAMLLTQNDFERIIIILLGLIIYSSVKFIEFLKNHLHKKYRQKLKLFKTHSEFVEKRRIF